jgi:hypothetical protein
MKILQTLVIDDTTYIFTENPEQDIRLVQELYEDKNRGYMGYELPILVDYEFLGTKYKAISFWHDNEDIRDIDLSTLTKDN